MPVPFGTIMMESEPAAWAQARLFAAARITVEGPDPTIDRVSGTR